MHSINLALQLRQKNDFKHPVAVMCCFSVPENIQKETLCDVFQRHFLKQIEDGKKSGETAFSQILDKMLEAINKELGSSVHLQVADAVANLEI